MIRWSVSHQNSGHNPKFTTLYINVINSGLWPSTDWSADRLQFHRYTTPSIYYVYPQSSWWQMIRIDKLRKFKMKFQFIKRLGSLLQFLNNNFRNFYPWTYKNTFTSCQSSFWFRIRWKRRRLNHHRNSMERWPRFRRWFSGFRIGKSAQACRSIFRRRGHPNYEGQVDQTAKIVHWSIPTITGT